MRVKFSADQVWLSLDGSCTAFAEVPRDSGAGAEINRAKMKNNRRILSE